MGANGMYVRAIFNRWANREFTMYFGVRRTPPAQIVRNLDDFRNLATPRTAATDACGADRNGRSLLNPDVTPEARRCEMATVSRHGSESNDHFARLTRHAGRRRRREPWPRWEIRPRAHIKWGARNPHVRRSSSSEMTAHVVEPAIGAHARYAQRSAVCLFYIRRLVGDWAPAKESIQPRRYLTTPCDISGHWRSGDREGAARPATLLGRIPLGEGPNCACGRDRAFIPHAFAR